ncbi:260_t:CDS:2, partial [Acaulospora colombiana]
PLAKDVGVNKMLHTLAAKALIQVFEDMPKTPETKAQIERLGKRYSLASSVTSFLAIDEEDRTEKQATVEKEQESIPSPSEPMGSFKRKKGVHLMAAPVKSAPMSAPLAAPGGAPMMPPPRMSNLFGSAPSSVPKPASYSVSKGATYGAPPPPMMYQQSQMQQQAAKDMSRSRPLAAQPTGYAGGPPGLSGPPPMPSLGPSPSSYPSAQPAVPTSLSVESLARAQKFDGSFPTDSQYFNLVTSGGKAGLPSALSSLGGADETKKSVWATLLTIACMEKRLAGEKDVWEFLADKARDYVSATLQDLCKDAAKAEDLMKELTAAASAAV